MADKEKILAALAELDPLDDDQWTADGAPLVEVVARFTGDFSIKRQDIINASPDFNREKLKTVEEPEVEVQVEPELEEMSVPSREMSITEFQVWLRTVPKEDLEETELNLKQQHDEIGAEIQNLQELQKRISQVVSITRSRIKESFPNSPDADAIRSFIESQTKAREQRVTRRMTILQNIRPEELDSRAPIDSAMSRKSKRGTGRPVRPLMK